MRFSTGSNGITMLVYHGSNLAVDKPRLLVQNKHLDFGPGFYTTTNQTQAEEFSIKAVRREGGGIPTVSVYEIDEGFVSDDLTVLRFDSPDEAWLDFVAANRSGEYSGEPYDVVVGAVANDDVFVTVTLYLSGVLTKQQAIDALKVKRLYDQYVWKTGAALDAVSFIRSYEVPR